MKDLEKLACKVIDIVFDEMMKGDCTREEACESCEEISQLICCLLGSTAHRYFVNMKDPTEEELETARKFIDKIALRAKESLEMAAENVATRIGERTVKLHA